MTQTMINTNKKAHRAAVAVTQRSMYARGVADKASGHPMMDLSAFSDDNLVCAYQVGYNGGTFHARKRRRSNITGYHRRGGHISYSN